MANPQECPDHEDVVRAICSPHYDEKQDRVSKSLFRGSSISVSRLAVLPLERLVSIFQLELETEEKPLWRLGEIGVGRLKELGITHSTPCALSVVPKPTRSNKAHAEIPQKISRGLANRIVADLKLHKVR